MAEPEPTANGYARIREVYSMLRDSEERLTKAFEKQLEGMEKRLFDRLDASDRRQDESWRKHEDEHQDVLSAQATLAANQDNAALAAKVKQERLHFIRASINGVENHWKFLALVLFAIGVLFGIDLRMP